MEPLANPPAEPAPPRARRLRKILIIAACVLGGLLLVAFIAVPPIAAAAIRSQFLTTVGHRLDATASLGGVSVSWTGKVSFRDLEIKDRAGATIAAVKSIDAHVGVMRAPRGEYVADFHVDSPRIELRRSADGRLNVAAVTKPSDPAADKAGAGGPVQIPDFTARLTVTNALILIEGGKEKTEIPLSGTFDFKCDGGRLTINGRNAIKDGSVTISSLADLRDSASGTSTADVTIERMPLGTRMGPVLELLHPAFSVASGQLEGVADGKISLKHEGSLLKPGEDAIKGLSGRGRLEIRDCAISGSNLLGDLLKALATEKREIRLNPVEFRIEQGRIIYDKPWQWTLAGSETTFTGSIGLDRTLDLLWQVPVSDELAERVPVLKSMRGKTFEAPIGGTVSKPRLDWKGVVSQVAEDKIEDAAKRKLDDLLGSRDDGKAAKLLEEADALYNGGRKAEAAEKYRKIKDDHRKTSVYKDNKDRINTRAEEKE
jgi:hypothetical protein